MARTEYGLQMYSLRDITEDSMKTALKKVAEMGYKYVEFAGFFDYLPEQIKVWLDEFGLVCSGTHTGMNALTPENIDETIRCHKIIGCENLIVPWADWASTPEKCGETLEALRSAQKKLAENGIRLGYHNHSREFMTDANGIVFEDELIKNTDIELEIDTFWAFNAGLDVIAYLEANKDRIRVVHLKDGIPSADDCKTFDKVHDGVKGLSVGSGKNCIPQIREWANKNGVLMVIESEGLDPTGLEEVGRCISYLRTLD
ncbi:MAG: sugar phosphate isomerase/epimerase [Clostridia bacterium]|nr:sugar phosphate isomerase/epimerase [Clostridia bacterium]